MELTDRAEALWASYEAEVRARFAGRDDVDAADVLAGLREHVESELSGRGVDRVAGEDMAEVLERVGGPEQWAAGDMDSTGPGGPGDAPSTGEGRATSVAAVALVVVGVLLVTLGRWGAMGWGFLAVGAVLARTALGGLADPAAESGAPEPATTPLDRLVHVIWWAAAVGVLALVVLGPAVVTWAAAQTGGFLEGPLAERVGTDVRPRPAEYWRLTALVIGALSGTWWLVAGSLVARFRATLRRLLGPAAPLLPRRAASLVAAVGAILLLASVIGFQLL